MEQDNNLAGLKDALNSVFAKITVQNLALCELLHSLPDSERALVAGGLKARVSDWMNDSAGTMSPQMDEFATLELAGFLEALGFPPNHPD